MSVYTDRKKLEKRIEAHDRYAKHDLNGWIFSHVKIRGNDSVLDIGCGTGKQLIPISKMTSGPVVGVDISREALDSIRPNVGKNVRLIKSGMDDAYGKLRDLKFDVILSSFAIYYAKDREKLLLGLKRLLKPNGKLFLCGPGISNNQELLDLHARLLPIPAMHKGYFENFAIGFLKKHFKKVETFILKNPIAFPDADSLADYWLSYSISDESRLDEFKKIAGQEIRKKGSFTTVKEVIGVLAH